MEQRESAPRWHPSPTAKPEADLFAVGTGSALVVAAAGAAGAPKDSALVSQGSHHEHHLLAREPAQPIGHITAGDGESAGTSS
jgi:hypothetical protein